MSPWNRNSADSEDRNIAADLDLEHAVLIQSAVMPPAKHTFRLGGTGSAVWLALPASSNLSALLPNSGRHIVGARGAGVMAGRFVDSTELPLPSQTPLSDVVALGESLRGSLSLTILETDGNRIRQGWLLADPLGAGMVWVYQRDAVKAISADLRSLRAVLSFLGIPLEKSPAHVASLVATGGGFVGSSWTGVRPLSVAQYIQADATGIRVAQYPNVGFHTRTRSVSELLDEAWEDALSNVRTLADAPIHGRRIAHLTGGSDSRAVLSLLMHMKIADRFAFACGGSRLESDKRISLALCDRYGLLATDYLGVDREYGFSDFEAANLSGFAKTDGMLTGVVDEGMRPSANLVLGGTYGEHFKVFFPPAPPDVSVDVWLSAYFSERILGVDPTARLMSIASVNAIREEVSRAWNEASSFDVPHDNWGDYLFLTRRNRYFLGETIRATSEFTPRVDPLYSPSLMSYVAQSSHAERATGEVMLAYIARGSVDLARFPFDKPAVQQRYLSKSGLDPLPMSDEPDPWTLRRPEKFGQPVIDWMPRQTEGDAAEARKRGMPISHVTTYRIIRPRLERLLKQRRDECEEILNVDLALDFLSRTPGHRSLYRTLTNAYRGLLWYFDDQEELNGDTHKAGTAPPGGGRIL